MISISVNNKQLFVPADTNLVIEQHNAVFDADNIASEIVWTFDLPAAPNDAILNNVTHEHVSCYKEYACKIGYDGMQIASGKLYVQQVNRDTLMCGIVLNNLHSWGSKKLSENDLPTDVISDENTPGLYQHFKNWLAYLKRTLAEDSRIKFPLFVSDGWSKSNKGYGYYAGHVSPLLNSDEADRNYVNRVIFDKNNNVDDRDDYDSNGQLVIPGFTPFNKILFGNTEKQNGHTMAPAIRLVWLLQEIFGGKIIGNFITNSNIALLFIQSLNTCDNNKWHTNSNDYLKVEGSNGGRDTNPEHRPMDVDVDGEYFSGVFASSKQGQIYHFGFSNLPTPGRNLPHPTYYDYCDEFYAIAVLDNAKQQRMPTLRMYTATMPGPETWYYGQVPETTIPTPSNYNILPSGVTASFRFFTTANGGYFRDNGIMYFNVDYSGGGGGYPTTPLQIAIDTNHRSGQLIQLTPSTSRPSIDYSDPNGAYSLTGTVNPYTYLAEPGTNIYYKLVKVRAYGFLAGNNTWFPLIDPTTGNYLNCRFVEEKNRYDVEQLEIIDELDIPLRSLSELIKNIYDLKIRYADHMPNLTNAELIGNLCKMFGLAMFYNAATNTMQLSFFKDLINCNYLDISEFVVETEKYKYAPGKYELQIETCKSQSYKNEEFIIEDAASRNNLPEARRKKRRVCLVLNENITRISEQNSDSFQWEWTRGNGNNRTLVVGDGDETTSVKPNVKVPNMRWTDPDNNMTRYIAEVDASGNSKMFDNDYTGEFEMVLTQYKGKKIFPTMYTNIPALRRWIEEMNPTCYDKNGNPDPKYISLTAQGEQSIGEMWQQPLFEFLANQEKFRFTAVLPMHVFLQVYKLMQPQNMPEKMQTRWLMVNNRRYLPEQINYTLGNGKVVAQIECSRYHTATGEETKRHAKVVPPVEVWDDNAVWNDNGTIGANDLWRDGYVWKDNAKWSDGKVTYGTVAKKYLWDDYTILKDTKVWTDTNAVVYQVKTIKDIAVWDDTKTWTPLQ